MASAELHSVPIPIGNLNKSNTIFNFFRDAPVFVCSRLWAQNAPEAESRTDEVILR